MPVLVLDWNGLLAAKVRSNAGMLMKIVLRNEISELVGVLAGSYNLVLWSCGGHSIFFFPKVERRTSKR